MWSRCRDELICDLAEVYHIYDPAAIPCRRLAVYAAGLGENSRVFMRMSGRKATTAVLLQAVLIDRVSQLIWMLSDDGAKGRNKPVSIYEAMSGHPAKTDDGSMAFDTAEDYEAARKEYMRGGQ